MRLWGKIYSHLTTKVSYNFLELAKESRNESIPLFNVIGN